MPQAFLQILGNAFDKLPRLRTCNFCFGLNSFWSVVFILVSLLLDCKGLIFFEQLVARVSWVVHNLQCLSQTDERGGYWDPNLPTLRGDSLGDLAGSLNYTEQNNRKGNYNN